MANADITFRGMRVRSTVPPTKSGEHLSRAPEKVELFDMVGKNDVDLPSQQKEESRRNHIHGMVSTNGN